MRSFLSFLWLLPPILMRHHLAGLDDISRKYKPGVRQQPPNIVSIIPCDVHDKYWLKVAPQINISAYHKDYPGIWRDNILFIFNIRILSPVRLQFSWAFDM